MIRINFYHKITGKDLPGTFYMQEKDGITHYFKRMGDIVVEIDPRNYTDYNIELYKKEK